MRQAKVSYSREVGKAKESLFKAAFKRIDRAISQGIHLEAITIIESIICDRLETIISVIKKEEIYPGTLGPLIKDLRKLHLGKDELLEELDHWRI